MTTAKRAVIYTRGSTDTQSTENQVLKLREHAERMGYDIVAELSDTGISGGKGRSERPAYKRLCTTIARKQADVVICYSVEILSRDLSQLVAFLQQLESNKVHLFLYQQGLDTSSASAMSIFQLAGVFAELERSLVRDRIMLGLDRARKNGTTLGRPTKANTPKVIAEVRALREQGMPVHKIARKLKIGVQTTASILAA
jgi:DNA invertase Pin-like site-specific DNA recombinase